MVKVVRFNIFSAGKLGLILDQARERRIARGYQAARIDETERLSSVHYITVQTVTGDSGLIGYDSLAAADQAVEKSTLLKTGRYDLSSHS